MIHALERYGPTEAEREFRERYDKPSRRPSGREPSFRNVLLGKIHFLKMVKGYDDPIYQRLRNKLHEVQETWISPAPKEPPDLPDHLIWQHWFERYVGLVFLVEVKKRNDLDRGTAFAHFGNLATAAHNVRGEDVVEALREPLHCRKNNR